jgi:hypothetical protein
MAPTTLLTLRKKVVPRIFITLKNPPSAGFEPANLGSNGKDATTRPPRVITFWLQ